MSQEVARERKSVPALLAELQGRANQYKMVRFENFSVEPFQDGIRISGNEGPNRRFITMDGPKFFSFAGVPENISGKLTRNLIAQVASELLHINKNGQFSALLAGDEPVCFQAYSSPFLPAHTVVSTLLEKLPGDWFVDDFEVKQDHVDLDIVTDQAIVEPKVGDITRLGLHLSLYDSTYRPTVVEGYSHRLFCGNGAQLRYNNRSFSIHADASPEAMLEQIVTRSTRLLADLPAIVNREAQQLIAAEVQNPVVAINRVAEELGRDGRVIRNPERIQEAFEQEPGNTMWNVMQAFSRAANSAETYEARTSLRTNAGKLLSQASRERCTACLRVTR